MPDKIVYFDNAATTFPKPESVYKYQDKYLRIAGNPGRGAHELAVQAARAIHDSRLSVATVLGIKQPERLVFTPGCTFSINAAIKGIGLKPGDNVVVSALEHNAVLRPLKQLERTLDIKAHVLPYARRGVIDLHDLVEAMIQLKPKLCVFAEASNVTGEMIDLPSITAICAANKVPLVLDAAQSAGRSPHDFQQLGVSVWCGSGHKGLFGPPGIGLMWVSPNIQLEPLVAGGTGSRSEDVEVPEHYPDRMEAGTMPGPAIAGLGAASMWIRQIGLQPLRDRETYLTNKFLQWAQAASFVEVYGNRAAGGPGTALVSFQILGVTCDEVARVLDTEYGIAVRSGLHCAATAHKSLGTVEKGLVRASFSYFNTDEEVDYLCSSLSAIAKARV